VILAIDPGAKGALAFFDVDKGSLVIVDMPTVEVKRGNKTKLEISPQMVAAEIKSRGPRIAVLERVGAMPGQGVSSMFQFGRGVGMLEGVLSALQIPVTYIAPQTWQKAVGARGGKDGNRARAAELFPAYADLFKRAKDDGRADAALMSWWAATVVVSK
jgi:crossover junction endodeoxyribonuclease RuvC